MQDVAMTYEAIRGASDRVKAHKERFDTVLAGLNGLVSELDGNWEGVAKDEFREAYDHLKPTLETFAALLERYTVELENEMASMMSQDSRGGRRIGSNLTIE